MIKQAPGRGFEEEPEDADGSLEMLSEWRIQVKHQVCARQRREESEERMILCPSRVELGLPARGDYPRKRRPVEGRSPTRTGNL